MSILQMEERLEVLARILVKAYRQYDIEAVDYYATEMGKLNAEIEHAKNLWQSQ